MLQTKNTNEYSEKKKHYFRCFHYLEKECYFFNIFCSATKKQMDNEQKTLQTQ